MVPVKKAGYEFSPKSLVDIRTRIGLSQSKMAKLLGVPANTLSRWETGSTTPDATSLAAIYAVAAEAGITPNFFRRRRNMTERSRLIVMWDFQNLGVSAWDVPQVNAWIMEELDKRIPSAPFRLFKAFAQPYQSDATEVLQDLGWRVWEDNENIDDELIMQCKSDSGHDPKSTAIVLITNDGDYVEPIRDLKSKGVRIYLIAPASTSQKLISEIGQKRWIRWPETAVTSHRVV